MKHFYHSNRNLKLFAVFLLGALCPGVQQGLFADSAAVSAADRQRLVTLTPKPLPSRLAASAAPTFYSSSNLYEYMDGGADIYQLYDVRAMLHQDFRAGEVEMTADVFDMGSAENAFGMYSSERSPKYDFIAMGTEGYRNEGIVNFFQDRYYVKLAAFGNGADRVLAEFAAALAKRIPGAKRMPPMVERLPAAGRKAHTEQFIRKGPLGHPFLSPAYQAVYPNGKGESILMVSVGQTAADAQKRMQSLSDHFRSDGKIGPAPEFGDGAFRASNSYEGTLIARVAGRYLVLMVNPGAGSETIFKDAVTRLNP